MVVEDIAAGLKNAVDKGFSLQSVVASFINAGYNPNEVNEAARAVNMGVLGQMDNHSNQTPRAVMKDNLDTPSSASAVLPVVPEVKRELYVPEPSSEINAQNQIQKLPTEGATLINGMEKKKGLPGYLIALIVFFAVLVLGALVFMIFGNQILSGLFK